MAIETKNKEIKGHRITVSSFPGRKAVGLLAELTRLLGPALLSMLTGLGLGKTIQAAKLKELDIDPKLLETAALSLVEKLNADNVVDLVLRLLACTTIDGKAINDGVFDLEFAGEPVLLFQIIGFVLEVNWGSFFGMAGIGTVSA